jgi:branched-chain amino acid transport system ATP-binding protein
MDKSLMRILEENKFILNLQNVYSGYGEIVVLKGVSINIPHGSIVTLIGANGAGKSTLLKTIFGLVKPTSGSIYFQGEDITGTNPSSLLKKGIAFVPQGRGNFYRMTIRENIEMGGFSRSDDHIQEDIEQLMNTFPVLRQKEKELAGTMSGGEQQILELAMALVLHPKLLLIDEPSLGLSPLMVEMVFKTIKEINHDGITVLMVEQNARKALGVSDYGFVLELGSNRLEGTGQDILNNEDVKMMYLGGNPKTRARWETKDQE